MANISTSTDGPVVTTGTPVAPLADPASKDSASETKSSPKTLLFDDLNSLMEKVMAPLKKFGIEIPKLKLDEDGRLLPTDPNKTDKYQSAKEGITVQVKKACDKNGLKTDEPGKFKTHILPYLKTSTEFSLLPANEQESFLKSGPFNADEVKDFKAPAETKEKRVALAIKLKGDVLSEKATDLAKQIATARKEKKGESEIKLLEAKRSEVVKETALIYTEAVKIDPGNPVLLFVAAGAYQACAEQEQTPVATKLLYGKAISLLDAIAQDSPQYEKVLAFKVDLYSASGQPDKALKTNEEKVKYLETKAENARDELRKIFDESAKEFTGRSGSKDLDLSERRLKTLLELAKTVEGFQSPDPIKRVEDLKRLQTFYVQAKNFEYQNHFDANQWKAYEGKSQSLAGDSLKFRKELRAASVVAPGTVPSAEQVQNAKLSFQISKALDDHVNMTKDLVQWSNLVKALPYDRKNEAGKVDQYGQIIQAWVAIRDLKQGNAPTNLTVSVDEIQSQLKATKELLLQQTGFISDHTKNSYDNISFVLNRVIDANDKSFLGHLNAKNLDAYAGRCVEVMGQFDEAQKIADPVKKRAALIGLLRPLVEIRGDDFNYVDKAVNLVTASMGPSMDATGLKKGESEGYQLKVYTAMAKALKGTGVQKEKEVQEAGADLAKEMKFSDSGPSVKSIRLFLARDFYEAVGDKEGLTANDAELKKNRVELLASLKGDATKNIPALTDSEKRLEAASFLVQIDVCLLPSNVEQAKGFSFIADASGKKQFMEDSTLASVRIFRTEIDNAKGISQEDKLDHLAKLGKVTVAFGALAKGDAPLLDAKALASEKLAIETSLTAVVEAHLQVSGEVANEKKAMAATVTADFKDRLHAAMEAGDLKFLGQLNFASIDQFAKGAEGAHTLLELAKKSTGPEATKKYAQAAALFAQLGLKTQAKEAMAPILSNIEKIADPMAKADAFLQISQVFQVAGMTEETNEVLGKVVALDVSGADPKVHQVAQLARALQKFNTGEVDKARDILATIPDNAQAQALLKQISSGKNTMRLPILMNVLQAIVGARAEKAWKDPKVREEKVRQLMEGLGKLQQSVLSGESDSLTTAMEKTKNSEDPALNELYYFFVRTSDGGSARSFTAPLLGICDPGLSDEKFAEKSLALAENMLASKDYGVSTQIAQMLEGNPYIGEKAKALVKKIPDEAKMDGYVDTAVSIGKFLAFDMLAKKSPIGLAVTLVFSERPVLDDLKDVAMTLGPLAVGRVFGSAGKALGATVGVKLFENSPMVAKVLSFIGGTSGEALGFTLANMTFQTAFTGQTEQWNLEHFGKEFGSMMVTFVVCHGIGMGVQKAGKSAESLAWLKSAEGTGLNTGGKVGLTVGGKIATIAGFTGTEYLNEAIGLKKAEDTPFYLRLLGSALMDAQMHIAGKKVDFLTGGKIGALEVKTELKLKIQDYRVALEKGEKPEALAKKADAILQLGDLPSLDGATASNAKVFEAIVMRAAKTNLLSAKDPVSMNLWLEAVSSYKSLVKNGESEGSAASKALEYAKSVKFDPKTGTYSTDLKPGDYTSHFFVKGDQVFGIPGEAKGEFEFFKLSSAKPGKEASFEEVKIGGETQYKVKVDAGTHEAYLKWVEGQTAGMPKPGEAAKLSEPKTAEAEKGFKAGQTVVPSVGKLGSAEFHLVSPEPVSGDPAFEKVTIGKTTFYRKNVDKATYDAYQAWQKRTTPPPLPKAVAKPVAAKVETKKTETGEYDAAALTGDTKANPVASSGKTTPNFQKVVQEQAAKAEQLADRIIAEYGHLLDAKAEGELKAMLKARIAELADHPPKSVEKATDAILDEVDDKHVQLGLHQHKKFRMQLKLLVEQTARLGEKSKQAKSTAVDAGAGEFANAALVGGTKAKAEVKDLSPADIEVRKTVFKGVLAIAEKLGLRSNLLYSPILAENLSASLKKFAERLVTDPHPEQTLKEIGEWAQVLSKSMEGKEAANSKEIIATEFGKILRGESTGKKPVVETAEASKKAAVAPAKGTGALESKPNEGEISGVKMKGNFGPGGEATGSMKGDVSGEATKAGGTGAVKLPGGEPQFFVSPESLRDKNGLAPWSAGDAPGKAVYEKAAAVWEENVGKQGESSAPVDRWAELAKLAEGGDPQAKAALRTLEEIHQGANFLHVMSEGGMLSAEAVKAVAAKLEGDLVRLEFYRKNLDTAFAGGEVPRLKTAQVIRTKNLSEIEKARQFVAEIEAKKALEGTVTPEEQSRYNQSKTLVEGYKKDYVAKKEYVADFESRELEKKSEGKESEISSEDRAVYEEAKNWLKKYEVLNKVWTVISVGKDPAAVHAAKDVGAAIEAFEGLGIAIQKKEAEISGLKGEEKSTAEQELKQLQGLRARNLQLVESWEKVAAEYPDYVLAFTKISGPFEQDEVRINSKENNVGLIRSDIQQKFKGDVKAYYEAFAERTGSGKDLYKIYGDNVEKFVEGEILPPRECPIDFISVESTPLHEYRDYEANFMKGLFGAADRLPLKMSIHVKAGDRAPMLDYLAKKYSDPVNNARIVENKNGVLTIEMLKPAGQRVQISVETPAAASASEAKTIPPPKKAVESDSGPATVKPGKLKVVTDSGPESAPATVKPGKLKGKVPVGSPPAVPAYEGASVGEKKNAISPPPPSHALPEIVFPKPSKVPGNLERKMAVTNDIFEGVYPDPTGRPRYLEANVIEEVQSMYQRLAESGHEEVGQLLFSDLEIAMKSPYESEVYQGAIQRLAKALSIRRLNPEFSNSPVELMGTGSLKKLGGKVTKVYDGSPDVEAAPPSAKPGSEMTIEVVPPKAPVSDLQAIRMLKEKGMGQGFSEHLKLIRKMKTVEAVKEYIEGIGKPYDEAAGVGVKVPIPIESKKQGNIEADDTGFAIRFSGEKNSEEIHLEGRRLKFRRTVDGNFEMVAFGEIEVVSGKDGTVRKIAGINPFSTEAPTWTKVEVGDKIGAGKKAFKGAAEAKSVPKDEPLPTLGSFDGKEFHSFTPDPEGPWLVADREGKKITVKHRETNEMKVFEAKSEKTLPEGLEKGDPVWIGPAVMGASDPAVNKHPKVRVGSVDFNKGPLPLVAPHADAGTFVIGRDPGNPNVNYLIDNPLVSGAHATITSRKDPLGNVYWYIEDGANGKSSTNGSSVEGNPIKGKGPYPIFPGQKITIGFIELKFSPQKSGAFEAAALPGRVGLNPAKQPRVELNVTDMKMGHKPILAPLPEGSRFVIGRESGNPSLNAVIAHDTISGVHAVITSKKGTDGKVRWFLQDGESNSKPSRNGVWVDGQKISGLVEIRPGQEINFAGFPTIFRPASQGILDSASLVGSRKNAQVLVFSELKTTPQGQKEISFGGKNLKVQISRNTDAVLMNPNDKNGSIVGAALVPGKEGPDVILEVAVYSVLDASGKQEKMLLRMPEAEARKMGIKLDAEGNLLPDPEGRYFHFISAAKDGLVPSEVQGVWGDNKPGAPRRGEVRKDKATTEYGTAAGKTHEGIGYGKSKGSPNEDSVTQGPNWALVLDGMGGHGHGDKASEIGSKAIAEYLQTHLPSSDPKETLRQAIIYAGKAVNATPYGKQGAGAVGVAHLVIKNADGSYKAIIGHVGDAGALVVSKDGKVKYRSKDQSLVQELADREGKKRDPLDEDAELEMRTNPNANVVTGTIGAGHESDPIVVEITLEPGDRLVMFSDGISDATSTKELAAMATKGKSAEGIQNLIFERALEKMADFDDAKAECKPWKRLPVSLLNGSQGYIDMNGDIYDSLSGGKVIDHYKADNMTVHVYVHDPAGDGSKGDGPNGAPKDASKPLPIPKPVTPIVTGAKADIDPIEMKGAKAGELVQSDLGDFEGLGISQVGKIPGLTAELEAALRMGDQIFPDFREGREGKFVQIHRLSGAQTMAWMPATREQHEAFVAWNKASGFENNADPNAPSKQGMNPELADFSVKHGIKITGGAAKLQEAYILAILKTLPDSFLDAKSPEGFRYLQSIGIGTGRTGMRGAAMHSAFSHHGVDLYSGAVNGPRQNLMGLLLHELGHSTGHRYALDIQENNISDGSIPAPPDSGIPLEVRGKMHDFHKLLGRKGEIYGLNWMDGKEVRIAYTAGRFQEFIAEFHLQYVADGAGLRKHIAGIKDPEAKAAYEYVYNELKVRVFGGKEYAPKK